MPICAEGGYGMLKVLLVDDEPFITQGLQVLIDWEQEGYEIPRTASNGQEAMEMLEEQSADLIIADINMPVKTGLEMLRELRQEQKQDIYFVILSGYAEFAYVQEAMRYSCTDYILKPVDKDNLLAVLRKVSAMKKTSDKEKREGEIREKAYLDRNLIALFLGKSDNINLEYVHKYIKMSEEMCYIEIQLEIDTTLDEFSDEEKRAYLRKLYDASCDFLKEYANHCVIDVAGYEKIYDIGFLYCDYMAKERQLSEKEFLKSFLKYIKDVTKLPAIMIVGKKVTNEKSISKSYGTSYMLRSLQGFRAKKDIYFYEEEVQVTDGGILLCKKSLDELIIAIEQNDHFQIKQKVDSFYEEMQTRGITGGTMKLNINYLMFQLIHLASEFDDDVNQEEIFRLISEDAFEDGIMRGSKIHLVRMAYEYGDYLAQLRKNESKGILGKIEREVKEKYASNLTLKELSERYYVNSAYLGQLFRKKYGCSFKDYLNQYRMEEAAKLLIRTDQKIYQIAEAVGYKDVDYFVNRFIAVKGCTPAKFRKQTMSNN